MSYDRILSAVRDNVWLIAPAKLDAILHVLDLRARGVQVDAATVQAVAAAARDGRQSSVSRSVAVLPIFGTIAQRGGLLEDASGFASTETIGREFSRLLADESVGSIILEVDSPGGTVWGVPELADKIFAARGTKPVVAVANSYAASAAYWIATAADEVVVTPSGDVGSVGAVMVHWDESMMNEQMGIKPTYISYGKYKVEGNPDAPLSEETLAELQRRVDEVGESFVKAVARNRGTTPARVKADFGQGRTFGAQEAVQRGMADRVATLDETITRLASGAKPRKGRRVENLRRKLELRGR